MHTYHVGPNQPQAGQELQAQLTKPPIPVQIFRDGNAESPSEYKGPRDAAGIVSYLKKKAEPASAQLTSQTEVLLD